jgi:hypothetical protein
LRQCARKDERPRSKNKVPRRKTERSRNKIIGQGDVMLLFFAAAVAKRERERAKKKKKKSQPNQKGARAGRHLMKWINKVPRHRFILIPAQVCPVRNTGESGISQAPGSREGK